jgi:hypothetical protein
VYVGLRVLGDEMMLLGLELERKTESERGGAERRERLHFAWGQQKISLF